MEGCGGMSFGDGLRYFGGSSRGQTHVEATVRHLDFILDAMENH